MYIVYSKPNCPNCDKAKALLEMKGVKYDLKVLDVGQPKEDGVSYVDVAELKAKVPSIKTVPAIFRGDEFIGGFLELKRMLG